MPSSHLLGCGTPSQPVATRSSGRYIGSLCLATSLVSMLLLLAGVARGMPPEHLLATASSNTQRTTMARAVPRHVGSKVPPPATTQELAKDSEDADYAFASQVNYAPVASIALKALAALGCAVAFAWGYAWGRKQQHPLPLTMASMGDTDVHSEWDKRVSVMEQVTRDRHITEAEFGDLLVEFVQRRFGEEETKRVVDSFRQMERGEEFRRRYGTHPFMEQVATSHLAGLTAKPDWPDPAKNFPWANVVQEGWQTIRAELEEVIQLGDEGLKAKGSIGWMAAQDGADSSSTGWKTLGLCNRGRWDDDNTRLFKNTCRILRKSRVPIMECFFVKLPAHSTIPPQSDHTNFVLTCHLGLKTPSKSHILCGDARHKWSDGGIFLLDTTFIHEAAVESNEDGYVLIMRVWHPELTATEIEAITFLFDCVDDSEIILHPDGLAMYDMMKAHQIMEWNAILGAGDTDEESQEFMRKMETGQIVGDAIQNATKLSDMVKERLKE